MVSSIVYMVLFGYVRKYGFIYLVWCCKINCLCYKPILFGFITHSTPTALVYLAVVLKWLLLSEFQLEVYCLCWKRWHHGQLMWRDFFIFYFLFLLPLLWLLWWELQWDGVRVERVDILAQVAHSNVAWILNQIWEIGSWIRLWVWWPSLQYFFFN